MSEFNSFRYGLRAMIEEAGYPIGGKRLSPENDRADDSGLSIRGEDTHHIAAKPCAHSNTSVSLSTGTMSPQASPCFG